MEWIRDWKQLFRQKKHLEPDARANQLGSVAAKQAMDRLRPYYWSSAHFHQKYSAVVRHTPNAEAEGGEIVKKDTEAKIVNEDDIDIDLDDSKGEPWADKRPVTAGAKESTTKTTSAVPVELMSKLPAEFQPKPQAQPMNKAPVPSAIQNTTTRFLALDKCLPNRAFLQALEIEDESDNQETPSRLLRLSYDKE